MPSVTLRDVPPELHKRLKESAERSRRSLNAEILWLLENAPQLDYISPERRKRIETILEEARRIRDSQTFETTEEELRQFKQLGRL